MKTRFTSTYKFFKSLQDNEKAVNCMFSTLVPRTYRSRVPSKETWDTTDSIVSTLRYPATVCCKAQDRGYWLLSDAMNRCGRLYYTFGKDITALETAPEDPAGTNPIQQRICIEMRREVRTWLRPFLEPLFEVVPSKAHTFLALMLDPRFKGLGVIVGLVGQVKCQALRAKYDADHLLPMMLAHHQATHSQPPANEEGSTPAVAPAGEEGCEDLQEDETVAPAEITRVAMVAELKKFRGLRISLEDIEKVGGVLVWWSLNEKNFPFIAPVARAILGIPCSQIECERIFSIAGLIVGLRRTRLSPEALNEIVNIYKNYPNDPTYKLPALEGADLDPAVDWDHLAKNEESAVVEHEVELREAGFLEEEDDIDA